MDIAQGLLDAAADLSAHLAPRLSFQQADAEALRRDERQAIPAEFPYAEISGLSRELCGKLERTRPATLAQAARIDGMTPAALTLILARLKHQARSRSA